MSKEQDALRRLGDLVERRADELNLTWTDLAKDAGITVQTLRQVRLGANEPSRATKRGLERALGWQLGSVDMILAGGSPALASEREVGPPPPDDDFEARIERIRNNPAARARLLDLLAAARLPEADEEDEGRERDSGTG